MKQRPSGRIIAHRRAALLLLIGARCLRPKLQLRDHFHPGQSLPQIIDLPDAVQLLDEIDADVNEDGFEDFFDYTDYVAAFEGGC